MSKRIDVKKILREPGPRRELFVSCIQAIQAREGIVTTRAQAECAYDTVQREKALRAAHNPRQPRQPRPDPEIAKILARHGLPAVPGALKVKFIMAQADWWVRTAEGWRWFDARTREWKPSIYGPVGKNP